MNEDLLARAMIWASCVLVGSFVLMAAIAVAVEVFKVARHVVRSLSTRWRSRDFLKGPEYRLSTREREMREGHRRVLIYHKGDTAGLGAGRRKRKGEP